MDTYIWVRVIGNGMIRTTRTGKSYEQTCILIPLDMKQAAKDAGINLASTFRKALVAELKTRGIAVEEEEEVQ
jgi:post-segregation antitoxin (ccd killing protein)